MLAHLTEWLALLIRWAHVVFGAAWIGTSFYFNWLNNNVRKPEVERDGVGGELWSVHGGAFYQVVKYANAPPQLPGTLHWFKFEAYLTWLSGFLLLCLVYYLGASSFLVDADSPFGAVPTIGIGIGALLGGWVAYDLACKSPLAKSPVAFAAVGFLFMTGVAFGLSEVMAPRAAYIHVGAMLGTMMAWNVFFVIIPNQRKSVDALARGEVPDPSVGAAGALRSLHNNYITLPVLFIMVSNHYPLTFGHEFNWAVLAAISVLGAGVRHWFNLSGRGEKNVWILPVAAVGMVALALVSRPPEAAPSEAPTVSTTEAMAIIAARCLPCHSANPSNDAFPVAPQGVMYDEPEQVMAKLDEIKARVVDNQTMPLGNLTNMSDEERVLLGAWIDQQR